LDAYALLYLMEKENLSIGEARSILMSKGGLYGISGASGDFRDIEEAMDRGDVRAELAFKTFAYNVKRYIGEYHAILNGAECIVFTAGAGQFSPRLRKEIVKEMDNLGIVLDEERNTANPAQGVISCDGSKVTLAIIPTNEEFIVADEVMQLLGRRTAH
ncbi:MAG: acetate kinase, partial [Acidobacteriota bacterium]